MLDDGSAGLRAVKDCGGIAVVQDPADAAEPGMPTSALAAVEANHVVPLSRMAELLCTLTQPRRPATMATVGDLSMRHFCSFNRH